MKKIFTFIFLVIFLIPNFAVSQAKITKKTKNTKQKINKKKCFIVTAYYSPLPNQKYYATGSYFRDVILNGRGHRGASGKRVFSGMLAAPSSYPFGTKIYLSGLGVAEVSDRGGAIVKAGVRGHACDRIDIWVGWGETGLKRALYWGKRKVYGNFMPRKSKITLNIKNFPAPNYVLKVAKRVYFNPIFSKGIGTKNPKKDVIALQKYLKKKCLYNGKIDGDYHKILYIILNIQKKHKLVKTGNEAWAGYWSYNTRQLFLNGKVKSGICKKTIPLSNFPPKGERIATKKVVSKKIIHPLSGTSTPGHPSLEQSSIYLDLEKGRKKVKKVEKNIYPLEKYFKLGIGKKSSMEDIKKYQKILKEMGLYKGKIDGNYNNIMGIISDFQLKNKLIKTKSELASGFIGPKTAKKLLEVYKKQIDDKIAQEKKALEEKRKKEQLKEQKQKEISEMVDKMAKLEIGAKGENVKMLQKILKHYSYFDYDETGYFGEKTKKALIKYQISRKIIKGEDSIGAGYVGPATRKTLKKDLLEDKGLLGKIKNSEFYANIKFVKKV